MLAKAAIQKFPASADRDSAVAEMKEDLDRTYDPGWAVVIGEFEWQVPNFPEYMFEAPVNDIRITVWMIKTGINLQRW
jgi:hypothetical protein